MSTIPKQYQAEFNAARQALRDAGFRVRRSKYRYDQYEVELGDVQYIYTAWDVMDRADRLHEPDDGAAPVRAR